MDTRRSEILFFVSLLVIAIGLTWLILAPYLGVFVLAGTLAFLFRPLYVAVLRIVRFETLAALISVLIVTLIVFLPLSFFGLRIFVEATTLYSYLTSHGGFDTVTAFVNFLHLYFINLHTPDIALNVNTYAQQGLEWFIQNIGGFFSRIAQLFFLTFLTLLGLFYFFKDGIRMKTWLVETVPLASTDTEEILREMGAVGGSVVRGTLAVAIILGIVMGVGFAFFSIPNPLFWAAMVACSSIVPIVGPWLVIAPAVGYLLLVGHTVLGIGLFIWSLVLVNIVYSILSPQLMHRGVNIHPYFILLSILGGIGLFGPIGFLTGPLVMALLLSLFKIYKKLVVPT